MARVLVITNPAAARTQPQAVRAIEEVFRQAGWQAEVLATGGPGDARRLAEYGVSSGADVVAVFGGDGTTMQAAAALVGTEVALAVIPGGTGNLLAGNLRIPVQPVRAARAALRGRPRALDLGAIEREDGLHYFAVACGAGYDAKVMAGTPSSEKQKWGFLAYVATTLRHIGEVRSARHHLTVDGREYDADAAMILVANCQEVIPPLVKLGPNIRPDDGILDVVVVRADSFWESVQAVWHIVRGQPAGDAFVAYTRGQEIRVVSEPVQPLELDGDAAGATPFTARVVPGAIRILAPDGA